MLRGWKVFRQCGGDGGGRGGGFTEQPSTLWAQKTAASLIDDPAVA